MKIITGGAGFIGSAICWRLNTMGINDIIIVDESRDGFKEMNLAGLKFISYIDKADFLKRIKDGSFPSGTDTLYHMGACSSTTETNMDYLKENNVEYSKTLANQRKKSGFMKLKMMAFPKAPNATHYQIKTIFQTYSQNGQQN